MNKLIATLLAFASDQRLAGKDQFIPGGSHKSRAFRGRGFRSFPGNFGNKALTSGRPRFITEESLKAERDRIAKQGHKTHVL